MEIEKKCNNFNPITGINSKCNKKKKEKIYKKIKNKCMINKLYKLTNIENNQNNKKPKDSSKWKSLIEIIIKNSYNKNLTNKLYKDNQISNKD